MSDIKVMTVEMPDGSKWAVPVEAIARNRAEYYADEFGDDINRSLAEDTMPLFDSDDFEISDWASNNMNWSDVSDVAFKLPDEKIMEPDYQEGWCNGKKSVRVVTMGLGK